MVVFWAIIDQKYNVHITNIIKINTFPVQSLIIIRSSIIILYNVHVIIIIIILYMQLNN